MKTAALAVLAAIATTPAFSQDWDFKLTPYLWAAGIDGEVRVGPLNAASSVDFADIVDVLDGAALLRVEAQTDRHGLFGDLTYMSIEDDEARDSLGGSIGLELDSLIFEGAYYYRFGESRAIEVGARYWDIETTLTPTLLQQRRGKRSWTDGFVGFRSSLELGPNWDWLLRANIGSGGSDFTAGLQMDFRRKFDSGNSLDLGLRILDIDYEHGAGPGALDLNMTFQGLTIGYGFGL